MIPRPGCVRLYKFPPVIKQKFMFTITKPISEHFGMNLQKKEETSSVPILMEMVLQ